MREVLGLEVAASAETVEAASASRRGGGDRLSEVAGSPATEAGLMASLVITQVKLGQRPAASSTRRSRRSAGKIGRSSEREDHPTVRGLISPSSIS